jgi:hypothetical protein
MHNKVRGQLLNPGRKAIARFVRPCSRLCDYRSLVCDFRLVLVALSIVVRLMGVPIRGAFIHSLLGLFASFLYHSFERLGCVIFVLWWCDLLVGLIEEKRVFGDVWGGDMPVWLFVRAVGWQI